MRQLKGKVKENAREKKERKKEFKENKDNVSQFICLSTLSGSQTCFAIDRVFQALTVALPTLGIVFVCIIIFVYFNTRPKNVV